MTSISVRPEDRLEGASNFNVWKARVLNILEEHDLDNFVINVIEEPSTNAGSTTFKKNQAKAKRIIFDSVKDNIMPIIAPLKTAKECFDTLICMRRRCPVKRGFLRTSFEPSRWRRMSLWHPSSQRSLRLEISWWSLV
jgi:hypothetical protein